MRSHLTLHKASIDNLLKLNRDQKYQSYNYGRQSELWRSSSEYLCYVQAIFSVRKINSVYEISFRGTKTVCFCCLAFSLVMSRPIAELVGLFSAEWFIAGNSCVIIIKSYWILDHDGNADSLPENHTWNVLLLVGCVGALAVVLIGLISVIVWCKKVWDRNNTPSAGNDTHGGTNVPLRRSVHGDGQVIQRKWKDDYIITV